MTTASKITLFRVFLIPVMMVTLYLSGGVSGAWMWVSLAIFILGSLSDFVDGQIARRCNQVTDFGKFLDPLADKLLTIAVMTVFTQWGRFPAWALMIVLTREFAVTGLRLVAAPKLERPVQEGDGTYAQPFPEDRREPSQTAGQGVIRRSFRNLVNSIRNYITPSALFVPIFVSKGHEGRADIPCSSLSVKNQKVCRKVNM